MSELRPFEICIWMVKNEFFLKNSKNIDILILRKEQNLFRSENYICVKFGQNWLRNARRKSKMTTTKYSFFDIWTSDRGDFPRIIVIALLFYVVIIFMSSLFLCRDDWFYNIMIVFMWSLFHMIIVFMWCDHCF